MLPLAMIYPRSYNKAIANFEHLSYRNIFFAGYVAGVLHKHGGFVGYKAGGCVTQCGQAVKAIGPPVAQGRFTGYKPVGFGPAHFKFGAVVLGVIVIQGQQFFEVVMVKCAEPLLCYS